MAPVLLCTLGIGCRTPVPDLSGKWEITTRLDNNHKTKIATEVLLTLVQTDATVHGDAALKMDNSKQAIHVPIANSLVNPDGKLMLQGSTPQPFGTVLFSFDGTGKAGSLAGTTTITAQTILGSEIDSGPVTYARAR